MHCSLVIAHFFDLFNHKCARLVFVSFMHPCHHNNLNIVTIVLILKKVALRIGEKINRLARFHGSDAPLNCY